jgi:hypothetical protein
MTSFEFPLGYVAESCPRRVFPLLVWRFRDVSTRVVRD